MVGKMPSFLDESEIWVEKVSSMEEKRGPEGKKRSYFWEKSGVFERRDRSFGEEWYGVGRKMVMSLGEKWYFAAKMSYFLGEKWYSGGEEVVCCKGKRYAREQMSHSGE